MKNKYFRTFIIIVIMAIASTSLNVYQIVYINKHTNNNKVEKSEPMYNEFTFGYQGEGRDYNRVHDYWVSPSGIYLETTYIEILDDSPSVSKYNFENSKDIDFVYSELLEKGFYKVSKQDIQKFPVVYVFNIGIETFSPMGVFSTNEGVIWMTKYPSEGNYRAYIETWTNESMWEGWSAIVASN